MPSVVEQQTYDVPRPLLVILEEENYYRSPSSIPVRNEQQGRVNPRPASSLDKEFLVKPIKMTNCIARALYDNVAESPDELAFRRNDVLTVLEQNTAGLEGWWLCSLRGRQGICPGNRLRIMPGVYDTGSGVTSLASLAPRPGATSPGPRTQQRPLSNKVVTPRRVGDVYTYDTPRALTQASQLDYDVPTMKHSPLDTSGGRLSRSSSLRYDSPRPHVRSSLDQYDVPRSQYDSPKSRPLYDSPKAQQQQHYDSPRPLPDSQRVGGGVTRSLIKGIRGGAPATVPPSDTLEYDVPRPTNTNQEVQLDMPPSDRSSGVSVMSCESSQLSTSSSASSLAPSESLSLSSFGGSSNRSSLESHDVYDFPPEPRKVGGTPRPKLPPRESKDSRDAYDVPRNVHAVGSETYDTPPSRTPRSLVMRGAGGEGVYDVPPQVSRDVRQQDCVDSAPNRLSSGSDSSGGDVDLSFGKDLPLEYNSALDTLVKLHQEVYSAIDKLTIVHQNASWLSKDTEKEREEELKIIVYRLLQSVNDIIEFSQGSVINASQNGERGVARRLQHLMEPVMKIAAIIEESWNRLRKGAWRAALSCSTSPENFNQLATIAHPLAEDVRLLVNTIQTKGTFIFKKSPIIDSGNPRQQGVEDEEKTPVQERPLPDLPDKKIFENLYENDTKNWLEDYDYVNLETRASVEREHEDIKKELPAQLRKSYDNLVKQSQLIVDSDHEKAIQKGDSSNTTGQKRGGNNVLDPNDRQVINFYGSQGEIHLQHLNTAIDAFLLTIENNQPPKVFIAHSKFVILNAHKLVYIGDSVHRNVVNPEIRTRVLNCSNALSDAMKNTVAAAKTAALQFPSVVAVQTMVDSFVAVSHVANNLKQAISAAPL